MSHIRLVTQSFIAHCPFVSCPFAAALSFKPFDGDGKIIASPDLPKGSIYRKILITNDLGTT